MCGILTLFKTLKTINSTTKKEILESGKPLNNRGPDNYVIKETNGHTFVFYRLSIMDTSPVGNQPFSSQNCTLVCNGEIYNYLELINEYNLD